MKNKLLKAFILLVFSCLSLVACSGQSKEFDTFAPQPTSELGQVFEVDSSNLIKINGGNIVEGQGNDILLVNYSWTNKGSSADTTYDNFTLTASQAGVVLKPTLEPVKDADILVTPLQPGETYEGIQQGFVLESDDPVTISVLGSDAYWIKDNKPMNTYPVKVEMNLDNIINN